MDQQSIYAKTPIGDEAVRQSTRVVQRNLRMVLVQVDGKLSVAELGAKIGDARMVENALRELEEGGYIAPALEAVSVWQESKLRMEQLKASAVSGISSFGAKSGTPDESRLGNSIASNFSTFGKPVLPVAGTGAGPGGYGSSPAHEPVQARAARGRSAVAIVAIGLVAVLLIAVLVLLLFPYNRFKPGIEEELGKLLQTSVRVGDVSLKLLPQPGLLLSDVRVGERGESVIEQLRIFSPASLLGAGTHTVPRVELAGIRITVGDLVALPMLSAVQGKSQGRILVKEAGVDRMSIIAGPLVLGELKGNVTFLGNRQIEKAALQTVDRSLRIQAEPSRQGPLLTIAGVGWRPSDESALTFDSLQARGLLQKDKLSIQGVDARVLGGLLQGNWLLDWSKGLVMAGEATLERLDCRKITAIFAPSLTLEGDLMGPLRLRGSGSNWQTMWANAELALDAVVVRGVLHGVDLGEAARRGHGSLVRAGSTRFDRLGVRLTIDPQRVTGRDLTMNAGMFTAAGHFVATSDRQVNSNLQVTMQTSVSSLTLPIRVSGTLPNLQAASTR